MGPAGNCVNVLNTNDNPPTRNMPTNISEPEFPAL